MTVVLLMKITGEICLICLIHTLLYFSTLEELRRHEELFTTAYHRFCVSINITFFVCCVSDRQ